ncbi:SDR family NAD(P)-dependent oxidoreductase [Siccirubricoccus sp. G192]|uniref:SDR family NAD(P)-dependent oxidoreductase n=1 Tax=Siccirubricoccus sp. G192 TaxID=2849651 RepID=UPI001C2B777A|nr:SDR family NAD(P)-dependent oxidoreductase [Siccirubricoccus sp. G192]MBV1796518.1 SDR family NAD(P)-dependent oxidoreductase [Siccirubricoccus sp. G192]
MTGAGNSVALIVGAGDAIGAAVGRRFAAGGYTVCLARRSAEKAAPHVEQIAGTGGRARAFSLDARDEAAVAALFERIENEVGPVEVCLFNAGANTRMPALETSARLHEQVWRLACHAGFLTGREAVRHMLPRGRGTLLFTGATASLRGGAGYAAFAAAKAGLRATAQSLAREFGSRGIHVAHLLIDGGVDSPAIHARRRARLGPDAPPPEPGSLIAVDTVAAAYWMLHTQPRDGWTHELDLRPAVEPW